MERISRKFVRQFALALRRDPTAAAILAEALEVSTDTETPVQRWVKIGEACKLIGKSPTWVRSHIGIFQNVRKTGKGRGWLMFRADEVADDYRNYIAASVIN